LGAIAAHTVASRAILQFLTVWKAKQEFFLMAKCKV
jgi:hypothetical protein